MLIAEIYGKHVPEARNFEDYLTSTVFGHLRYLEPGPFWDVLFGFATSAPVEGHVLTATAHIQHEMACSLSSFAALDVVFWPEHTLGIPDLVLHFERSQARSLVILIEAKLTATKSGKDEDDQLARYLRILDSLSALKPAVPADAFALAVYLTATDSRSEMIESLQQYGDSAEARRRLYHLQWQDLICAIDNVRFVDAFDARILDDVRQFLKKRDLEYFSGMENADTMPDFLEAQGEFLEEDPLFDLGLIPVDLSIIVERWMHAN